MKKLVIISSVLVAILAGILVAPSFIDWSEYKQQGLEQARKVTGHDISINGDVALALLPSPRIYAENIVIAAPEGSAVKNLATAERLSLNVALMPLLKGQIAVDTVNLVKPDIALEILKDGTPNWLTPELQALMTKDKKDAAPKGNNKLAQAVSFENISIEDGAFQFKNTRAGSSTKITAINTGIEAETLQGPFKLGGQADFSGNTIDFKATTGALSADSQSLAVNLEAAIGGSGVQITYAGVTGLSQPFEVQGETTVQLASMAQFLKGTAYESADFAKEKVVLKGILTAGPEKMAFKNAILNMAGAEFSGDLGATFSPLKLTSNLKADNIIDLDKILPAPSRANGQGFDPATLGKTLPQSLSLPAALGVDIKLSAPGIIYRKESYSDVSLGLTKKDGAFGLKMTAASIPGKGNVELGTSLKFASRSLSEKTGSEIYSDPSLSLSVKGRTQNLPYTLSAVSGNDNLPYANMWKSANVDLNIGVAGETLTLKESVINLDDSALAVSGTYTGGKRPKITANIRADSLDIDKFKEKKNPALDQQQKDLAASLKALSFPYDLAFDVSVDETKFEGRTLRGLVAKGALGSNSLQLTNFTVADYASSSVGLKGVIGSIKELSGIDMTFALQSKAPQTLARTLKIDTSSWPQNLGTTSVAAAFKGDANAMDVNTNIRAGDGELIVKGQVNNPMAKWTINNLTLQAKHKNMAEAIRMFSPGAEYYGSLARPLDFYAQARREGKQYTLSGIKADLAGTPMNGDLHINAEGTKPYIKGSVQLGDLAVTKSKAPRGAGKASQGRAAAGVSQKGGARWSREAIDTGWMHAYNADLDVTAGSILYGPWDLKNPALKIALKDGTLNIDQLNAGLFDGQVAFNGTIRSFSDPKKPLNIDAKAQVQNVSVEDYVKALAGSAVIKGKGRVNMDVNLKTLGLSPAALVFDLTGDGVVTGNNLVLEGFDLTRFAEALSDETKPGDTLLGLWKGATKGGSTQFDTMDGAFVIREGVVGIQKLDMDGPKAFMSTKGNLNLPSWTIATAHTVTLKEKPDVPPFTINISGPLDNPANTFAQGAINDYLARKVNRKLEKLLSDKLGLPSGRPQQPVPQEVNPSSGAGQPQQQQRKEITPEEAFRGLLEGLIQ